MFFKQPIAAFAICTFLLSGCVTNTHKTGSPTVGPGFSSSFFKTEVEDKGVEKPKLDVVIPVFDPGLPENPDDYEKEGIWPELRRAEANRFAFKLKQAMDATGSFGAIRITPDESATGDLYILGTIEQSNGEEVEIDLTVIDISGDEWLNASFEHEVKEAFHNNLRNDGQDAYDPVFELAANKIADELKYHGAKELEDLQYLANMRFGASFSEQAFKPYFRVVGNKVELVRKMSEDDPMYRRVMAIRTRDQMFVDSLQTNYVHFSEQMNESYLVWQEQSLIELKAAREARLDSIGEAVGGALLVGLAIFAAVEGSDSDNSGTQSVATTGAILSGMAGAKLLQDSFKTNEEVKVHRDALNELGKSVDMELASQVIEFEKETVKLNGDARQQFMQWREFLKKIYAQESTPDVIL